MDFVAPNDANSETEHKDKIDIIKISASKFLQHP